MPEAIESLRVFLWRIWLFYEAVEDGCDSKGWAYRVVTVKAK